MEQAVGGSQTFEQDVGMLADDTRSLAERLSVDPAVHAFETIEQGVEMLVDETQSLAERRP